MENQDRKEEKLLDELETMYRRVAESEKSEAGSLPQDALQSYYESLQVSPNAPPEKIKESYERLVAFWEPGQFVNSPPLREEAERKLAEITHAYEKILAARQRESKPSSMRPSAEISGATDRSLPEEEMGYRFPWPQILFGGAAFVVVVMAWLFWPAIYQYGTIPSGDKIYQIRTNRLTGSMTYFDGVNWSKFPFPVAQPPTPSALPALTPPANPPIQSEKQPITAPPENLGPAEKTETAKGKEGLSVKTPGQPAAAKGYAIQVSALRDLNTTKEFVEAQKKNGHALYWARITTQDRGVWYRIYLGHFADRAEAARYMQGKKIKESFPGCFIQKLSG